MLQRSARNAQAAGLIDPMQVDAPPEENDNTEEEVYEVDIDSFVRKIIIFMKYLLFIFINVSSWITGS